MNKMQAFHIICLARFSSGLKFLAVEFVVDRESESMLRFGLIHVYTTDGVCTEPHWE